MTRSCETTCGRVAVVAVGLGAGDTRGDERWLCVDCFDGFLARLRADVVGRLLLRNRGAERAP